MKLYSTCISLSLLLVLALKIVQPAESTVVEKRENDKAAMSKIHRAIQTEHRRQEANDNKNDFSRRLLQAERESPRTGDALKQILADLRAAQQEQQDAKRAVEHLQNFISGMHSFLQQNQQDEHQGSRHLNADPTTGQLFEAAVWKLAMASKNEDDMVRATHDQNPAIAQQGLYEVTNVLNNAAIAQQGLFEVTNVLHSALQKMSAEKLQGLAEHLVQFREEYEFSNLAFNPDLAMSVATKGIGRLLDRDDIMSEDDDEADVVLQDVLALIWIMPVSLVAGTFFWAFAGLESYGDIMTPFQIWIFEITWVSRVIGCAIDNDFVCTAVDQSSTSRLPPPSLSDIRKEGAHF